MNSFALEGVGSRTVFEPTGGQVSNCTQSANGDLTPLTCAIGDLTPSMLTPSMSIHT